MSGRQPRNLEDTPRSNVNPYVLTIGILGLLLGIASVVLWVVENERFNSFFAVNNNDVTVSNSLTVKGNTTIDGSITSSQSTLNIF